MVLKPKVEKGFFIKDGKWTCFRRNHFQVALDMEFDCSPSAGPKDIFLIQEGRQINLCQFFVSIQAHGALSFSQLKIYQSSSSSNHIDVAPIDFSPQSKSRVSFRRLQFNQSTPANNNRHYADRFFSISLQVHCIGEYGITRKLAECHSTKLVVLSGTPGQYKKEVSANSTSSTSSSSMSGGVGKQMHMKREVRPYNLPSHRPTNSAPIDFALDANSLRAYSPSHRPSHSFDYTQAQMGYMPMHGSPIPTSMPLPSLTSAQQSGYIYDDGGANAAALSGSLSPPLHQWDSTTPSSLKSPPLFSPTHSPAFNSAYPGNVSATSTPQPDLNSFFEAYKQPSTPSLHHHQKHASVSSFLMSPDSMHQYQASPLLSGASTPQTFQNMDEGTTSVGGGGAGVHAWSSETTSPPPSTLDAKIQDFFFDFNH